MVLPNLRGELLGMPTGDLADRLRCRDPSLPQLSHPPHPLEDELVRVPALELGVRLQQHRLHLGEEAAAADAGRVPVRSAVAPGSFQKLRSSHAW